MDCFQDFCLACDRESADGPYCSQACRMADLEKANAELSPPSSPTTSSHASSRYTSSSRGSGSGYVLAPRFTPSTFDRYSLQSHPSHHSTEAQQNGSYHVRSPLQQSHHDVPSGRRSLTPSSSRTSLSSTTSLSSQSPGAISEQARLELQTYFSSFDQARAAKRRSSTR